MVLTKLLFSDVRILKCFLTDRHLQAVNLFHYFSHERSTTHCNNRSAMN